MRSGLLLNSLRDQRGVALPMAMLTLVILSALVIAFSVLSASEPAIANNQMASAQARAIAEAGLERAIWALNNPTDPNGLPNPLVLATAPYDGSQLVTVSVSGITRGGFRVTVANAGALNERTVTATGWVPNDTAARRTHAIIQATVQTIRFPDPPAPLTVQGEVEVGGGASVDARADNSCGNKSGVMATDSVSISGAGNVYGADGDNTANQLTDYQQGVLPAVLNPYYFTNAELDALKAIAQSRGTYYQGTVVFNASNMLPDGLIFVDTVSGQNIDVNGPNTTPSSDFASVTVHGNAPSGAGGVFHGWLFSNGTLAISGNFQMQGMAYAQNDFTYMGTGNGQIQGAVMSKNIRDTSSTNIDTDMGGNSLIVWNCNAARTGGGALPPVFTIKGGTYREISG